MNPIKLKVVNELLMKWGTPIRQTPKSAGYDLHACIETELVIPPEATVIVPTGIALDIEDPDIVGLLYARSGLALKHGLSLANGVGVIDADYQGEINVLLRNESWEDHTVRPGDRIAQLVFAPVLHPPLAIVASFLSTTERGTEGFGSTGVTSDSSGELQPTNDLGIS